MKYEEVKKAIGETARIYCVKEKIENGKLVSSMIVTHVVLALGLIDLAKNDYDETDENKHILIDRISKLLLLLTGDEATAQAFKKDWKKIFGALTLKIKPFSEELRQNILAMEAVSQSL